MGVTYVMIPKNAKTLVLERLSHLPKNAKLVIGSDSEPLDKEKLIQHVEEMDEAGEEYVEMELLYLRSVVKRYAPA